MSAVHVSDGFPKKSFDRGWVGRVSSIDPFFFSFFFTLPQAPYRTIIDPRTVLAASSYILQPSSVVALRDHSPARDDPRSQRPTHAGVPREARARHQHIRGGVHGISRPRSTLPGRRTKGMCYMEYLALDPRYQDDELKVCVTWNISPSIHATRTTN